MDWKKIKVGLVTLSAVVALVACGNGGESSSSSTESTPAGEKVVFNLPAGAEIPTMDSTKVTDVEGFQALGSTAEGLYRNAPDGKGYDVALAAEKPTVSEDGLTVTYKLRDTKWSNGDPLTANDFVYAWQRLVDPATAAEYSYLIGGVIENADAIIKGEKQPSELGVKAIDDKTLEVKLETSVPYLESLLAMAPLYPLNKAYVEEQGDKYASDSDHLLYIGPYLLTKWDGTGLSWTYVKNPDYWDADVVKADEINVQVVKEVSTGLNLFDTGALERIVLTGEYVVQRKSDPNFVTEGTSAVFFIRQNVSDRAIEALKNKNIRKALAMSIDKTLYTENVLQNGSFVANGLVPANLAANPKTKEDFRAENGDLLKFDAAQAKNYWETGLKELGITGLTLRFLSDDSENAKRSSEFIQAQLQDNLPGLTINLENVPFKVRLQKSKEQDFDLVLSGWSADFADPINYLELFETTNGNNDSKFSNAEYDALIAAARKETKDLDKRWADLLAAEKILMEEAGIAPLYQRARAALMSKSIGTFPVYLVGPDYDYKYLTKAAQ